MLTPKRNPDQLLFGTSGSGGTMHLSMELFKLMTRTRMVHVPYKGMQQVITEIIGGRLQILSDNVTSVLPHVTAGRLRALGVTGRGAFRSRPTFRPWPRPVWPAMRLLRGAATWSGGHARARSWQGSTRNSTKSLLLQRFANDGWRWESKPVGGTPARFTEHVNKETAKWTDVIKRAGIKGD